VILDFDYGERHFSRGERLAPAELPEEVLGSALAVGLIAPVFEEATYGEDFS